MRLRIRLAAFFAALGILVSSAGLAGELAGFGELDVKDTSASTVVIGSRTYLVTDQSVIRDAKGVRMELDEVPIPHAYEKVNLRPLVTGRFDAQEVRGRLVLITLDLVDAPQ